MGTPNVSRALDALKKALGGRKEWPVKWNLILSARGLRVLPAASGLQVQSPTSC